MPTMTRKRLLDQIEELKEQNEELQSQLDEVADIVTPPEDEDEGTDGE